MITTPPPDYAKNYYTKALEWHGVYILGNDAVPDEAIYRAAEIVFNSMPTSSGFLEYLASQNARFVVIPEGVSITNLPDYGDLYTAFPGTNWDQYRGLGGVPGREASSAGVENLLSYPTDPYQGEESVALHEWAHMIENLPLLTLRPDLHADFNQAYQNSITQGLWSSTYAITTFDEYFAELVQVYFNNNPARVVPGIHNSINTRVELASYDPQAYAVLQDIFGGLDWQPGKFFGSDSESYIIGNSSSNLMFGNGGSDWLYGQGGDDTINAGAGAMDVSLGDGGNDTINGEGGMDYMYGYAGNDTLRGGDGDDVAYGGTGNDELYGDDGADWLFGEAGNDKLFGGAGADILMGGAGTDEITGGAGNDWMWGSDMAGAGDGAADTFFFGANWGGDVIWDFEDGTDRLDVSGAGITSFADLTIGTFGQFTTITSATGDIIYLRGAGDMVIAESDISAADFIFA